eukprot:4616811-Pleurochrysis_carterae.AAC.2
MESTFGKPSFRWISCRAFCPTLLPPKNKRAPLARGYSSVPSERVIEQLFSFVREATHENATRQQRTWCTFLAQWSAAPFHRG